MQEKLENKLAAQPLDFESFFSQKAMEMKASEVRELLKLVETSDVISLAGGLPAPETFPVDIIKEITMEVLSKHADKALQYGTTKGFTPLRLALARWMEKRYGIPMSKVEVMIVAGSQQALDLIGRVFIDPGDIVVVEAPTYLAALNAFKFYDPEFISIPLDDDGMKVDVLEEKLKKLKAEGKRIKFVYTVSTFQNPAGVTMSLERRKHLIELANEYDFLIVEDNPYSELRYSGEPIPPIKHFDDEGRVIYLGTFSKIFAPGFRLGWVSAHPHFIRKMEIAKQAVDLCANPFGQVIAWKYVEDGHLDRHIPRVIEFYKPRRDAMLEALEEYMPEGVRWTKPDGGMFIWVTLPEGIDTKLMMEKAVAKGVAYVPGEAFFAHREVKNTMRLNFTYVPEEKIREGVRRLAEVIEEEIKKLK
ncbi:multiple substrate aminotransferase [Thermococcus kodakarensis KOD1]|uniref:Multiple substrate aminotransferase n=1 Tax=Thermococcus kodakarensis (strain ATCC BAA-918 / JCM 12380 / KOD1) TaxID=69014 RepID=Q5JFM8_THEKO|nr:PLP-dependent aminotransferase family protein [Thermococcus kodakarensis]WCN29147.1 PLP-dependent aminotransferase family protein [Thermococcus kodakarensis]WCN31453.1 PLP-dependent aminotransferase family protein [Thermococcus kodakarensis]BAD84375.1 multiple substrate aminotransferase [Thermococcus kodakarensis KOD1]